MNNPILLGEPMRNNRFLVDLPISLNINSYLVQGVDKPSFSYSRTKNEYRWSIITIKIIDTINKNKYDEETTTERLYSAIETKNILKEDFIFTINVMDGLNDTLDQWWVNGKIINISFDELEMSDDGISMIRIIVEPNEVKLNGEPIILE